MENSARENPKKPGKKQAAIKRELANSVWQKKGKNMNELVYEGRARDFSIVPDELTYAGKYLTHGEKAMWLAIFSCNRQQDPITRVSWPGVERLAVMLGVRERQALTYLKGLKEKDLLLTRRRQDQLSLMVLLDPPKEWMEETLEKLESC